MPIVDCIFGIGTIMRQPDLVNMWDTRFGDRCRVAAFCEIGGCVVGDDVAFGVGVLIGPGAVIGSRVFVGAGTLFVNTKYPSTLKTDQDVWEPQETYVEDDVMIGARSVILPGITLGQGCSIGAGSVVTKDVPSGETWVGNPARKLRGK
jgi:UDP-2-acetamido-3-amino-2,3-dideoxy-glucuronate N-acetyltransferase